VNPYDPVGLPIWRQPRKPGTHDPDYALAFEPGQKHGSNGSLSMSVLGQGQLYKRRAVKRAGSPAAQNLTWLVGELDGVRCYGITLDSGMHVVLTREDLVP
jgi:hypothetical protein